MCDELISVIVPAYNCAPWLPDCLDSLMNQTWDNLEIIIVNDGSEDETGYIMDGYEKKDRRIRCIHQQNGGVTSARLRGVKESTGSWIGFVDGDDILEPEMLKHLMENAQQYDVDITHCGFQVVMPDGTVALKYGTGILKEQDRITALKDLLEESVVEPSLCTKLFRRKLFEGLSEKMPSDIKNNEDMLMNFFLFSEAQRAVFEDICPYHYMIHPGSASRRKLNRHLIFDPIRVRQIIVDACMPEIKDDAKRALARMCLVSSRQLAMEPRGEFLQERKELKRMVCDQLPNVAILSKRNALLIKLISNAQWAFELVYRLYALAAGIEKE